MMIRLTAQDCHCAVELLDEQQTDHLMAECHLAEGYLRIGALIDCIAESVRAANDECQSACGGVQPLLQLARERQTAVLLAVLIQQHNKTALHGAQDSLALQLLLLRFAQALGVPEVGDNLYVKGDIMLEALHVRLDHLRQFIADSFAHYKKSCLQNSLIFY